jgi:nitroreductase
MSAIELGDREQGALVAAASAAPSIHNTQPWRFVTTPTTIEVHADLARGLRVIDCPARAGPPIWPPCVSSGHTASWLSTASCTARCTAGAAVAGR